MSIEFELDNSKAVADLRELNTSLQALQRTVRSLDQQNLTKVRREFESLRQSPLESVRALARGIDREFSHMGMGGGSYQNLPGMTHKVLSIKSAITKAVGQLAIDTKVLVTKANIGGILSGAITENQAHITRDAEIQAVLDKHRAKVKAEGEKQALAIQKNADLLVATSKLARAKVMAQSNGLPLWNISGEFSPYGAKSSYKDQMGVYTGKARANNIPTWNVGGDFSPYNARDRYVDPMEMYREKARANKIPTSNIVGDFSVLTAGTEKLIPKTSQLSSLMLKLGGDMNYAHSAARGLASGFGLMELTWGAMLPLLAGAAVSYATANITKLGAEVDNTLAKIKYLSGETTQSVNLLKTELLDLARSGPFGPKEIAEAMKTLSLAGYNAADVMKTIKPVLDFSVAGDTSIEKAADVLTGVTKAFKYGADGFQYVSDVISKTAAATKSSVEDMGEAFKMASTVYTKFGVGIEDTALVLGLLSNVNIRGTAAGTSLRNMLTDLSGRSPKAIAALKELGMTMDKDILDKAGRMRSLEEIMGKIITKAGNWTGEKRMRVLGDLFSERGDKSAYAFLTSMLEQAELAVANSADKSKSVVQKLKEDIKAAYGFTIIASAEMSLTPLNQMKSVTAAFQATLVETFDRVRPYIVQTSNELKAAFGSEGFKNTLDTLAMSIGFVVANLMKFSGGIVLLGALAVAVKGAAIAWSLYTSYMAAASAATLAFSALPVGRILIAIGLLLSSAIALWNQYRTVVLGASKAHTSSDWEDLTALNGELKKQQERLELINKANREKINIEVLTARTRSEAARLAYSDEYKQAEAAVKTAEAAEAKAKAFNAKYNKPLVDIQGVSPRKTDQEIAADKARAAFAEQKRLRNEALADNDRYIAGIAAAVKEAADFAEANKPKGIGTGKEPYAEDALAMAKRLRASNSYTSWLGLQRSILSTSEKELNAYHSAGLISEGKFFAEKFQLSRDFAAIVSDETDSQLARMKADYNKQLAVAKKAKKDTSQMEQEYATQVESMSNNKAKAIEESDRVVIDSMFETAIAGKKAIDVYEKWLKVEQNRLIAEEASAEAVNRSSKARPEELAQIQAVIETTRKYATAIDLLELRLNDSREAAEAMRGALSASDPDGWRRYAEVLKGITNLEVTLAEAKVKGASAASKAGEAARMKSVADQYKKFAGDFSNGISDAISTSIFEGGKEGGKSLRKFLEQELLRKPLKVAIEAMMGSAAESSTGSNFLGTLFKYVTGASFGGGGASVANDYSGFSSNFSAANYTNSFDLMGARANGGPVSPNSNYRVNELGMEMLTVGGKDYLMTGAQGGDITPASKIGTTITYAPQINVDSRTDQAQVYALIDRAVKSGNAKLIDDLRQAQVI